MTRKERKQKRRKKRKEKLANIIGVILTEEENKACWKWARMVTKNRPPARLERIRHKRFTCSKCGREYCIDGLCGEQYCNKCYITENKELIEAEGGTYAGCMTTHLGDRECLKCGGEN